MQIQLVRSATLRLESAGRRFLIDPYLAAKHSRPSFAGKSPNPLVDLPCAPQDVIAGAERVLVAHLHSDHFDPAAQELLPETIPLPCRPGDATHLEGRGFRISGPATRCGTTPSRRSSRGSAWSPEVCPGGPWSARRRSIRRAIFDLSHDGVHMDYPLALSFKLLAVSPQLSVTDATGRLLFYVRQKAFKLKESVTVFADREQTRPVATISADRVLDISATYRFKDPNGNAFGAVRRQGLKSFWKAHYDVLRQDAELMSIRENNAWVKLMDGILTQIPLLGLLSGYVFQPSYDISRADGTALLRLKKRPAFLEGRFSIDKLGELAPEEEALAILSILMMVLLERSRG